jgi:hypothetical protein
VPLRARMYVLVALLAIFSIACCCSWPIDYNNPPQEPNDVDLVGTYVLHNQTMTGESVPVENLRTQDGAQVGVSRIILHADGSCIAENIPHWVPDGIDYLVQSVRTTTGYWTAMPIGSVGDRPWWGLRLETEELLLAQQDSRYGVIVLAGQEPPYDIVFIFGDPDSADTMTYRAVDSGD